MFIFSMPLAKVNTKWLLGSTISYAFMYLIYFKKKWTYCGLTFVVQSKDVFLIKFLNVYIIVHNTMYVYFSSCKHFSEKSYKIFGKYIVMRNDLILVILWLLRLSRNKEWILCLSQNAYFHNSSSYKHYQNFEPAIKQ